MMYFKDKMKAVTFSYDDGVKQDERLIRIFDKYGLKGTFNINSELLGTQHMLSTDTWSVDHSEVEAKDVQRIYKGHEIAVHTLTHPNLTTVDEKEIIRQVEQDRENLENMADYPVVGMAYPCGGINNNEFTAKTIKENTKIQYARTITSSYQFDLQEKLYQFNPTVYHLETERMKDLALQFIELKPEKPMLFYIWGHSYEFDINDSWNQFEEFCKLISGHDDIYYGTNREVLLK